MKRYHSNKITTPPTDEEKKSNRIIVKPSIPIKSAMAQLISPSFVSESSNVANNGSMHSSNDSIKSNTNRIGPKPTSQNGIISVLSLRRHAESQTPPTPGDSFQQQLSTSEVKKSSIKRIGSNPLSYRKTKHLSLEGTEELEKVSQSSDQAQFQQQQLNATESVRFFTNKLLIKNISSPISKASHAQESTLADAPTNTSSPTATYTATQSVTTQANADNNQTCCHSVCKTM